MGTAQHLQQLRRSSSKTASCASLHQGRYVEFQDCQEETPTTSIDSETEVPTDLYMQMLKLGKAAKRRGQHTLKKRADARTILVLRDSDEAKLQLPELPTILKSKAMLPWMKSLEDQRKQA